METMIEPLVLTETPTNDLQRRYDHLLADMKAIANIDIRNNIRMHDIAIEAVRRETNR